MFFSLRLRLKSNTHIGDCIALILNYDLIAHIYFYDLNNCLVSRTVEKWRGKFMDSYIKFSQPCMGGTWPPASSSSSWPLAFKKPSRSQAVFAINRSCHVVSDLCFCTPRAWKQQVTKSSFLLIKSSVDSKQDGRM